MKRRIRAGWLGVAVCIGCLSGCVERRFVITTDPLGANVYDEKNLLTAASPADRQFTYYGKYRFTLVRDGFQTMIVEEQVRAPWYEIFPLEFISENLIPWPIRDVRRFHYVLQPAQLVPPEDVLNQGTQLRQKGRAIPSQPAPEPAPLEAPSPGPLMPPAL